MGVTWVSIVDVTWKNVGDNKWDKLEITQENTIDFRRVASFHLLTTEGIPRNFVGQWFWDNPVL